MVMFRMCLVVSELGDVATQKEGRSDDPPSTIDEVAKVAGVSNPV